MKKIFYPIHCTIIHNTSPTVYSEGNLSGLNVTGFKFGLQYDPLPTLHLGLTYRTLVKAKAEGEFTFNNDAG